MGFLEGLKIYSAFNTVLNRKLPTIYFLRCREEFLDTEYWYLILIISNTLVLDRNSTSSLAITYLYICIYICVCVCIFTTLTFQILDKNKSYFIEKNREFIKVYDIGMIFKKWILVQRLKPRFFICEFILSNNLGWLLSNCLLYLSFV